MRRIELQRVRCGVDRTQWQKYDMTQNWGDPQTVGEAANRALCYKIAHTSKPSSYHIRRPDCTWEEITDIKRAKATAYMYWKDMSFVFDNKKYEITRKHITEFIDKELITITKKCMIPVEVEYIRTTDSDINLNDYIDMTLDPSGKICYEDALPILRMIRYALCSDEQYVWKEKEDVELLIDEFDPLHSSDPEMDNMWNTITSPKKSNFKWVINWLANIRQNVGTNSSVALFFHGKETGIGKNTLSVVMGRVLGKRICKLIKEQDIERGWTDGVKDRVWIHADEWTSTTIRKHNALLKGFIGNAEATTTARLIGEKEIINTTSWYFTSNEPNPVFVDDNERRYTLIDTTGHKTESRMLAKRVYDILKHGGPECEKMLAAFNAVLCSVKVNHKLIQYPLENEHRQVLKEMNKPAIELWLESAVDDLIDMDVNGMGWLSSKLFSMFKEWHLKTQQEETKIKTTSVFGRQLQKHKEYFDSDRRTAGATYRFKLPIKENGHL